jgi:hypothetical protein
LQVGREGGREGEKQEKKVLKNRFSFPYCTSRGRRIVQFKMTPFYDFVFFLKKKRNLGNNPKMGYDNPLCN